MNETDPTPWYRRQILPSWTPEWLAVSSIVAITFGTAFALFLEDDRPWRVWLMATAGGFVMALACITLASVRNRLARDDALRIRPPEVVRIPLATLVAAFLPTHWIIRRTVYLPSRGPDPELFHGTAAVIAGFLGIALIGLGLAMIFHMREKQEQFGIATRVLSFVVLALAAGYGAYSVC